jgi:hypothetical protein
MSSRSGGSQKMSGKGCLWILGGIILAFVGFLSLVSNDPVARNTPTLRPPPTRAEVEASDLSAHVKGNVLNVSGLRFKSFANLRIPKGVTTVICQGCPDIIDLKGLGENITEIDCTDCANLLSLIGAPAGMKRIICHGCRRLNDREVPLDCRLEYP